MEIAELTVGPDRRASVRVVYFIRAVGLGFIKIGVANCVFERMKGLGHSCPVPLELLGVIKTDARAELENRLHRRFSAIRERGEWFRETDELIAFISSEAAPPESPRRPSMAERKRLNAIRRAKRAIGESRAGPRPLVLTDRQRKFLAECPRDGWPPCCLRGAETQMAYRLEARGLAERRFVMGEGDRWFPTDKSIQMLLEGKKLPRRVK